MASSISKYHRRRLRLLKALTGWHVPKCESCGAVGYKGMCVHHPEDSRGRRPGGWQALYEYEQDLRDSTPVVLLCNDCHDRVDAYRRMFQPDTNRYDVIIEAAREQPRTIEYLQDLVDADNVADGVRFLIQRGDLHEVRPGLVKAT